MATAFRALHWSNDIPVTAYHLPASLPEALELLERFPGKARVLAGGTDVIPELRRRDSEAEVLVDISRLPGLNRITQVGEEIRLGALVTHAQAAASPLIRERAGLLAEGADAVGSPQIRNVATVAGNLISARPAADTSLPLLALGASVVLASRTGERTVPLTDFFLDLGKTVLNNDREILTEIRFPGLQAYQGGSYFRLSKRKALTLPMLVAAAVVTVDPGRKIFRETAIALGPVAPTPYRALPVEAQLRGAALSREVIREAAAAAVAECSPRDSLLRGSCDYRQEMIQVLVRRALQKAVERTGFSLEA
ncbi:MAG: xanthine dehydrogenase family protein subunit M [Deltaproteobacteria bacterium]|nr:xanthine dehydrogenase family protein subunit M [Deltaproteobacteria bacterium]